MRRYSVTFHDVNGNIIGDRFVFTTSEQAHCFHNGAFNAIVYGNDSRIDGVKVWVRSGSLWLEVMPQVVC